MTCKEFVDFLMDYFSGSLHPMERASFEAHLHECADCVAYLDSYEKTIQLGKAVCCRENDPVPEDVPEDLIQAILHARPELRQQPFDHS